MTHLLIAVVHFRSAFNSLNHILLSESADGNVQNRMQDFLHNKHQYPSWIVSYQTPKSNTSAVIYWARECNIDDKLTLCIVDDMRLI